MNKKSFKVNGMDCASCAMLIELDLEDENIKASCDYVSETLEVEINDKNQEKRVIEIVEKAGFKLNQT